MRIRVDFSFGLIIEDWERLTEEFAGHETILIAESDCIGDGEALCNEVGVTGFPTLKFGDPFDLEDYEGPREYKELSAFAKQMKVIGTHLV